MFLWIQEMTKSTAKCSPTTPRSWISSFSERTNCRMRLQRQYYRQKKCYWTVLHRVCNSFLPFNGVWLLLLQFLCSNATCNILHITIGSYFVIYSNWTTYSWNIIYFTFPSSSVLPLVHVCKPAAVEQDSLLYFKMNKCVICFHDALGNLHHKSTWSLKNFSKNLPLKIIFVIISED